jgi:hypothetical protein
LDNCSTKIIFTGDDGPTLVVRRVCFTSQKVEGNDGQCHNLFKLQGRTQTSPCSSFTGDQIYLFIIIFLQPIDSGVSGLMKFTSDRNLIGTAYKVINVIGTGFRRIGYWSNSFGLSVMPPEKLNEQINQINYMV